MIHIIYSCYNNYDLLIGENLDFIEKYRENIVIVDDHSVESELAKGRAFALEKGIKFISNPRKGIQAAIDEYIKHYCLRDDWVIVMQQDVFFRDDGAIERLARKVDEINRRGLNIGAFGFPNYIPDTHYHKNHSEYSKIKWFDTWLGVFFIIQFRAL